MASLPVGEAWKKGDEEDLSKILNCLCTACGGGNAVTTMLPTKIPLFREIYIMYLQCDDCNFRNSEVSFGGEICEQGKRLRFTLTDVSDLNRQLIKSDSATLSIPCVELEIPAHTQRGTITTVEGFLTTAADNLQRDQAERLKIGDVDNFHRCRGVIGKLRRLSGHPDDDDDSDDEDEKKNDMFTPFDIILDDPAGNSFVENPNAPTPDPHLITTKYTRTPNQDMSLGLQPSAEARMDGAIDDANPDHKNVNNNAASKSCVEIDLDREQRQSGETSKSKAVALGRQEVMRFPTPCPSCTLPSETDMCVTDIPHFKEIIIMSLFCEHCGYKSNDIKGGGAIPQYGTTITLRVEGADDLEREILKSDTAGVTIPEIDMELGEGGLNGLYTTVEGLLNKLHDRLKKANPFGSGDAAVKQHRDNDGGAFSKPTEIQVKYREFLEKLHDMANGNIFPFTLVIIDPLSNSFVGPIPKHALALSLRAEQEDSRACYDTYVDHGMDIVEFERSQDQNDDLGLSDMKTENYQHDNNTATVHNTQQDYGTDVPVPLPDRLSRLDHRGPDHPHKVGMAPVEGDNTVMGEHSNVHATPGLQRRGTAVAVSSDGSGSSSSSSKDEDLATKLAITEKEDTKFEQSDSYMGRRAGMVFKRGAQGVGYYTDVPLL